MTDDLGERYAAALANAECEQRPRCVRCMADAVMAVRDGELERLRDEVAAEWRQRAKRAERSLKALTAEAPPLPDGTDDDEARRGYAERTVDQWRKYATYWRERAEQAEAVVARVREVATAWRDDAMKRADVRPVTPDHAMWAAVAHVCALALAALDDTPEADHG